LYSANIFTYNEEAAAPPRFYPIDFNFTDQKTPAYMMHAIKNGAQVGSALKKIVPYQGLTGALIK
jgi:hypothetical protein